MKDFIFDKIIILDFGSANSQNLTRKIRDLGVYSELLSDETPYDTIEKDVTVKGIILAGKPESNYDEDLASLDVRFSNGVLPVFGIGYDTPLHPIVEEAEDIIKNFLFNVCKASPSWTMDNFITYQVEEIKKQVGTKKVLCALSGGVDSSVVAKLIHKAVGDQLVCVFVNHGLLRKGEPESVIETFQNQFHMNLVYVDASKRFLDKLAGVTDPETKRKIIGKEFIEVFNDEARKLDGIEFLAQGTIYADIIESGTKTAQVIKSHHNVGGLPEDLKFELVEPIRQLFKDEVREMGDKLGLPSAITRRQPFPGPGLGVRVIGAITEEKLKKVRESDYILREEVANAGLNIWQYFTLIPGVQSVGVHDEKRSYEDLIVIRAVQSVDAFTADFVHIPWDILEKISKRITSEVTGVNRVAYDVTSKPPATIEWE